MTRAHGRCKVSVSCDKNDALSHVRLADFEEFGSNRHVGLFLRPSFELPKRDVYSCPKEAPHVQRMPGLL